jgi:hypothetical protein
VRIEAPVESINELPGLEDGFIVRPKPRHEFRLPDLTGTWKSNRVRNVGRLLV